MTRELLLVVGAERFLAWVVLFMICYLTFHMSRRIDGSDIRIPLLGMSIESGSWGVHQFNWWVHHVWAKMAKIPTSYDTHLIVAGFSYIGIAIGGAMIMYPLLVVRFGNRWPWAAGVFMITVWIAGYIIGMMWIKA